MVGKKGRKEMFYLTTHLTHFINGYMASKYGKGLLYPICSEAFYASSHRQDSTQATVKHSLERETVQWVHHEGLIRRPIAP